MSLKIFLKRKEVNHFPVAYKFLLGGLLNAGPYCSWREFYIANYMHELLGEDFMEGELESREDHSKTY